MFNEIDRELNRVLKSQQPEQANPAQRWAPAVDIRETEESYLISMDIPGVDPKAIEVSMENDILEVSGERRNQVSEQQTNAYHRRERLQGEFKRRFKLPEDADASEISANSVHGVLQILVKKRSEVVPRRIRVN
jgi:HSP20 family protein